MTKENICEWLTKNGWSMTKQSPLGGFEGWTPSDRRSVGIFILANTVLAQGREVNIPVEAKIEDVREEDGKLIIGGKTVLGRLSTSPTYGRYTLSCTLEVTYESQSAEERKKAEREAEDALLDDFLNRCSSLESTRITKEWKVVKFTPEGGTYDEED